MQCSICGEQNAATATKCSSCGSPLEISPRSCPRCGTETITRFCGACGLQVSTDQKVQNPGPQVSMDQKVQNPGPSVQEEMGGLPQPPGSPAAVEYVGFWLRLLARVVDEVILSLALVVLTALGNPTTTQVLWTLLVIAYYILFTGLRGQTPGKMVVGIKVVNEAGEPPGIGRAALREIPGKLLSFLALGLGFVWAAWDDRKQAWHDKIARTYVVKSRSPEAEAP